MILYINCCPRDESRTERLAGALLSKLCKNKPEEYVAELKLYEVDLQPLNKERLDYRTALIEKGDFSDKIFDYAKQFAAANEIVIAAPFWDLSFPATLKTYIENIYITGIVSAYDENGMPKGLCKAEALYYVTTAGGPYDGRYSYDYISSLAKDFFGVKETQLIMAEMLDIQGMDAEEILKEAIDKINRVV